MTVSVTVAFWLWCFLCVPDEEGSISSTKTHSPGNAEEDSKTAIIVKKKTRPSYESLPSHSVESLTKRLESGSLSQSTRKRLRKRLNRLIKERLAVKKGPTLAYERATFTTIYSHIGDKIYNFEQFTK